MKRALAVLALVAPLAAWAPIAGAADSPDAAFYKKAAEGGIAEVEAGKLAQQKSSKSEVKDFGAMMVKDHTAAGEKLKAISDSKGISLPSNPSVGQMADKTKLEVLSGDALDKAYIKGQINAHQDTIELFQKEIASGQDPDAQSFATKTLPTVRAHLKAINSVAAAAAPK